MLLVVLLLFNWDRSQVQLCALLIYSNRMQWCKQRGSEKSAFQPPGSAAYALAESNLSWKQFDLCTLVTFSTSGYNYPT